MLKELWDTLKTVASALFTRAQRTNYADALFLPRGQGPGILILGGITMLAISLFLSLRMPRRAPVSAGPTPQGAPKGSRAAARSTRFSLVHSNEPPPKRVQAVQDAAKAEGLGEPRYVEADPGRHGLAFPRCPGGTIAKESRGCKTVRDALERQASIPVRIVIVSCNPVHPRPCVMEIEREERQP